MNAHTAEELQQLQELPLDEKIQMTKRRIQQWYLAYGGQVYVSFSGGKDSTVLLHVVRQMFPDVPAVFVNTGLEYPEVVQHVKNIENVVILRPEMDFRTVITRYGYPVWSKAHSENVNTIRRGNLSEGQRLNLCEGYFINKNGEKMRSSFKVPQKLINAPFKISARCCSVMKKKPLKKYQKDTGRMPILGTMADESIIRRNAWLKNGCNAFDAVNPKSTPMAFWTQQDVLHYIVKNGLKIPAVYGDIVPVDESERIPFEGSEWLDFEELKTTGCDRTGCMFCMYGAQIKGDQRFIRMKKTHPKIYAYCMKPVEDGGLGLDDVLTYFGIPH